MTKVGFLFSLYEATTGENICTTSVSGTQMAAVLKEIAGIVKGHETTFGTGQVVIKPLKVSLDERVMMDPIKMDSMGTMLSLVVEHYESKPTVGNLIVENCKPTNPVLENLRKVLSNPKKLEKLKSKLDELDLPSLDKGDTLLVGKFKNRRAEITGFETDEHGQPVAKTTKGDQKIFKPRIAKLMPESHRVYLAPGGSWEHFDAAVGEVIAEGVNTDSLHVHLKNYII